jgi:hypothetical protein
MVLRCSAHHGRSANVDEFNGGVHVKGVEITDDQVDGRDAVRLEVGEVARLAAIRQDAPVNLGVESLDTAVKHLG